MNDDGVAAALDALAHVRSVAECQERGLVFGWHPGLHHAESDPRRSYCIPQETGWWCRQEVDAGMDVASFPTLAEALDGMKARESA